MPLTTDFKNHEAKTDKAERWNTAIHSHGWRDQHSCLSKGKNKEMKVGMDIVITESLVRARCMVNTFSYLANTAAYEVGVLATFFLTDVETEASRR